MEQWDVIVIGAGVAGSAVARELARYRLNVAVLEKELDVACGNSSRNTGMLHAGFTYKPGSLKAECAVEGNKEFDRVAAELGVPFKRTGKLVVGFIDHDMENILKAAAIAADPEYGEVVCHCENVTRAEMVQVKLRAEDLNQTDDLEVRVSC